MKGVTRGEAARRAITQAVSAPSGLPGGAAKTGSAGSEIIGRLEAFRQLQRRLQLTPEKAEAWQTATKEACR